MMRWLYNPLKYVLKKFLWLSLGFMVLSALLVTSLQWLEPPIWMWKIQRQVQPPKNYPKITKHQWQNWKDISRHMKLAVIAAEDQRFPLHSGFDYDAIVNAIEANQKGKPLRGASTISQQTAKNLFLWPDKSLWRKAIEAWFTVLLESLLTKQRILEIYLNIIEFGPGIWGVEAASQHYFQRTAKQLSRHQSASLAAVLPNPYRLQVKQPSSYVRQRTQWIKKQMSQLGHAWLKKMSQSS